MPDDISKTTQWQPIARCRDGDVLQIVKYTKPPALGQHIGRVHTLPDGRWLVLKFAHTGDIAESYFILPGPPL